VSRTGGRGSHRKVRSATLNPDGGVCTSESATKVVCSQFFPIEVIRRFRDVANDCELVEYDGATHGFFNPRASQAHFEATTAEAVAFLRRVTPRQPTGGS